MNELTKKSKIIRNSIFNEDSLSILTDVLENRAGIEVLGEIPLVSYAVSLLKIADYARNRWLLRKIAQFLKSASQNQLSEEERAKALRHFTQDEKTQGEELDYVIQILDRYLEEDKSGLLALVYIEFIKGSIDLPLFKTYAEVINRFLPGDLESLEQGECEFDSYETIPEPYLRLASMGLMQKINRIISDTLRMPNPQFNSGFTIPPFESGGTFKYTSLGIRLFSIFFPDAQPNLVKLDFSSGMYIL